MILPILGVLLLAYWLAAPDPVTAGARTASGTAAKAAGSGVRQHWAAGRPARQARRTDRRDRWGGHVEGAKTHKWWLRGEHAAVWAAGAARTTAGIAKAAVKPVPAAAKTGWAKGKDRHRAKAEGRPVPVVLDPPWWRPGPVPAGTGPEQVQSGDRGQVQGAAGVPVGSVITDRDGRTWTKVADSPYPGFPWRLRSGSYWSDDTADHLLASGGQVQPAERTERAPERDVWQDPPVTGSLCEAAAAYDPDDDLGVAAAVAAQRAASVDARVEEALAAHRAVHPSVNWPIDYRQDDYRSYEDADDRLPECTYCGNPAVGFVYRDGNVACARCIHRLSEETQRRTPPGNQCRGMVLTRVYGSTPSTYGTFGNRTSDELYRWEDRRCPKGANGPDGYCRGCRPIPGLGEPAHLNSAPADKTTGEAIAHATPTPTEGAPVPPVSTELRTHVAVQDFAQQIDSMSESSDFIVAAEKARTIGEQSRAGGFGGEMDLAVDALEETARRFAQSVDSMREQAHELAKTSLSVQGS